MKLGEMDRIWSEANEAITLNAEHSSTVIYWNRRLPMIWKAQDKIYNDIFNHFIFKTL